MLIKEKKMKRIVSVFLVFCLMLYSGTAYPSVYSSNSRVSGLTYDLNAEDGKTNSEAQYAKGSTSFVVQSIRSASAAATYCVGTSGAVTRLITSNTPRWTSGYWDETGFHYAPALSIELSIGNYATYSEAFDNAAWAVSNTTDLTVAANTANSTDPAGANGAEQITCNVGGGTITHSTSASGAKSFSVFLKRKTGTGVINISANGTTWVPVTLYTDTWVRVWTTLASSTNPSPGIQIMTAGDVVYAWGAELSNNATNAKCHYVPADGSVSIKNAESLYISPDSNISSTAGTIVFKGYTGSSKSEMTGAFFAPSIDTNNKLSFRGFTAGSPVYYFETVSGGTTNASGLPSTYSDDTDFSMHTLIGTWGQTADNYNQKVYCMVDGVRQGTGNGTYTALVGTWKKFVLASSGTGSGSLNISRFRLYDKRVTEQEMKIITEEVNASTVKVRNPYLLMVGDSITNGSVTTDSLGYRRIVQDWLIPGTYEMIGSVVTGVASNVYGRKCEGTGGEQASTTETKIYGFLSTYWPTRQANKNDTITILIGSNDITAGRTPAQISLSITNMVKMIHRYCPDIKVYVLSTPPRTNDTLDAATTAANVQIYSDIATLQATKSNLYWVDDNAAIKLNASWKTVCMADTIHPNDAGHEAIGKVLADAIKSHEE